MNETIAFNCRKLKHSGLIHACYSRNGNVYIKENETSRPFKVFHLRKLISLVLDHFQNNDGNDQYHDVSVDANSSLQSSYSSFQLDLIKCWFVVRGVLIS